MLLRRLNQVQAARLEDNRHWVTMQMARQEIDIFTTGLPASFKSLLVQSAAFRALLCHEEYKRQLTLVGTLPPRSGDHDLLLADALGWAKEPSEVPLPDGCGLLQDDEDFRHLCKNSKYPELMLAENNLRLVQAARVLLSC